MAARANYFGVTVNAGANTIKPNTVVSITVHGGGVANIYSAETGGTVSTGSVTSDTNGVINIWLDPGKYDITPTGGQTRVYDTGQGSVASGDLTGSYPAPTIAPGRAAANIGSLGGDLSGTLPSPTLAAGRAAVNIGNLGGHLSGTLPNPLLSIPTVTSLPANPINGQEIYYTADPAAGVTWHFRYNSNSGSAYKWEFVGGASIIVLAGVDGAAQSANTTPAALYYTPSFTTPFAGDWELDLRATFVANVATNCTLMGIAYPSNAVLTHQRSLDTANPNVANASVEHTGRATGVAYNTAIAAGIAANPAAVVTTYGLTMKLRPIRVG